jgi:hypothetical protein
MDAIILAVIIFVAIAGPSILALVHYWRNNPDRRRSWRRAAEDAADTDPEHFRRPSAQWLFFGSGGGSGGGGGGGGGATAEVAVPAKSQLGEGFEPCLMLCRHPTLWRWMPRDLRLSHTG